MYNPPVLTVDMGSPQSIAESPSQDGRSKNARAQARHREKRKAYIRQLEDTLSRLQAAMSVTGDHVGSLPTSLSRIRDLERENQRLRSEVQSLRRHVAECLHSHSVTPLQNSSNTMLRTRPRSDDYSYLKVAPVVDMHVVHPIQPQRRSPKMMEDQLSERAPFAPFAQDNLPQPATPTRLPPVLTESYGAPSPFVEENDNSQLQHYQDYTSHDSHHATMDDGRYSVSPPHETTVFPKQEYSDERLIASNQASPQEHLGQNAYCPQDHNNYQPTTPIYSHSTHMGWTIQAAPRRTALHCA